ncbi:MAG: hypothetical protein VX793_05755 [Pseudomonadota bacterium]|nr:hypothetical protein [Pseudomonadota bacterium]
MRHILSIAIVLCLLILVAVYFLSDSEPDISKPGFDMAPEQSLNQNTGPARQDDVDAPTPAE